MARPKSDDRKIRANLRWKESLASKFLKLGKPQEIFDHLINFALENWDEFKKFTRGKK